MMAVIHNISPSMNYPNLTSISDTQTPNISLRRRNTLSPRDLNISSCSSRLSKSKPDSRRIRKSCPKNDVSFLSPPVLTPYSYTKDTISKNTPIDLRSSQYANENYACKKEKIKLPSELTFSDTLNSSDTVSQKSNCNKDFSYNHEPIKRRLRSSHDRKDIDNIKATIKDSEHLRQKGDNVHLCTKRSYSQMLLSSLDIQPLSEVHEIEVIKDLSSSDIDECSIPCKRQFEIEVPSWRILTNGDIKKQHKLLSNNKKNRTFAPEDTSTVAFQSRHAKLELGEIKLERRFLQLQQHSERVEKQRKKEMEHWNKRRPSEKGDNILELEVSQFMPSQLTLSPSKINKITVNRDIPVIAFGSRVCRPKNKRFSLFTCKAK